jgi:hypothetical protein
MYCMILAVILKLLIYLSPSYTFPPNNCSDISNTKLDANYFLLYLVKTRTMNYVRQPHKLCNHIYIFSTLLCTHIFSNLQTITVTTIRLLQASISPHGHGVPPCLIFLVWDKERRKIHI